MLHLHDQYTLHTTNSAALPMTCYILGCRQNSTFREHSWVDIIVWKPVSCSAVCGHTVKGVLAFKECGLEDSVLYCMQC